MFFFFSQKKATKTDRRSARSIPGIPGTTLYHESEILRPFPPQVFECRVPKYSAGEHAAGKTVQRERVNQAPSTPAAMKQAVWTSARFRLNDRHTLHTYTKV